MVAFFLTVSFIQLDRLPQAARVPRLSGGTRAPPRAGRRLAADRQHLVRQCLRVAVRPTLCNNVSFVTVYHLAKRNFS